MIEYKRKTNDFPIRLKEGEVPYFYFPLLENTRQVTHGFSTRLGGVSKEEYTSMNLASNRTDSIENVRENYRRICKAMGMKAEDAVVSKQTHTTNIRIVHREDAGKGIFVDRGYEDIDGLMTDEPNLPLVTLYADCVPLYFFDPVKRVIALSHSGWRGTVNHMGEVTIEKMNQTYGCKSEDILACIGPSICVDCYEVGEEVAGEFLDKFSPQEVTRILQKGKIEGKYQLDLWKANEIILKNAGITNEHLAVTNVCTCCNPDLLFSHRYTKGKRGNLGAFLCLKNEKVEG
ncbi:hypothetical protein P261_01677 [Lachnospiraceae bacterium TWA4]|nr:hypothetical protein P261_01677 [Lachnospiraceae bacterium TWA4]